MPAVAVDCAKYQIDSGILIGRFNLFLLFFLVRFLISITVIMFMTMLLSLLFSLLGG